MKAQIVHPDVELESMTPERCFIVEAWNDDTDPEVSIARSRVAPGVTTQLHALNVDERYLIVAGRGEMHLGDIGPHCVEPGDIVVIPAGVPQRIANDGKEDLVFYCICSPRFKPDGYHELTSPPTT